MEAIRQQTYTPSNGRPMLFSALKLLSNSRKEKKRKEEKMSAWRCFIVEVHASTMSCITYLHAKA